MAWPPDPASPRRSGSHRPCRNAASGSTAFRHACIEVASGITDVAGVGVDARRRALEGRPASAIWRTTIAPFTHFAMLCDQYASTFGVNREDIALVAVKTIAAEKNARSIKRSAHRRDPRRQKISGTLTSLQCAGGRALPPPSSSPRRPERYDLDKSRAVRVVASVGRNQRVYDAPR
jgi:hypothetical protein